MFVMTESARSASQPRDVSRIATEPEEFERFYREHLDLVRAYLARRVDDPFDVADLTADIFLRAIAGSQTYRRDLGPPRAWLIGIARNTLGDHRRARARGAAAVQRLGARRMLDADATERIVERVAAESEARALLAAIAELPASLQSVVELIAVDDLSPAEAARVLGISPGAARVRYHRARGARNTRGHHLSAGGQAVCPQSVHGRLRSRTDARRRAEHVRGHDPGGGRRQRRHIRHVGIGGAD